MSSVIRRYGATPVLTPGDTKMSLLGDDHNGWMKCDGRLLDKDMFISLFNAIGYTFGGSGANFKLPDMRGRVAGAAGTGAVLDMAGRALTARAVGTYTGEEVHLLTIAEMPSHTHGYTNNTNDQGTDNAFNTQTAADNADLSATTTATGGGLVHNIMQPTLFLGNMFVYAGEYVF